MRNITKVGAQKNFERGLLETQVHQANIAVAVIVLIGFMVAIGTAFIPRGFFQKSSKVSVNLAPSSNPVQPQEKPAEIKAHSFAYVCPDRWSCKQDGLKYVFKDPNGKEILMRVGVYDLSGYNSLDVVSRDGLIGKGDGFVFKVNDEMLLWLDLIPGVNAAILLPSSGKLYDFYSNDLVINQDTIGLLFGTKISALSEEQQVNTVQVTGSAPGKVDHLCIGKIESFDETINKDARYCIGENIFRFTSYAPDIRSREIYRKFVYQKDELARIVSVNELRSDKPSSNDVSLLLIGSMAEDYGELGGFGGAQISISRRWPELVRELSIPEHVVSWELFGAHWNPSISKAIVNPLCIEGCSEYQFEGYDLLKNQTLRLKFPDFVKNEYSGDREVVVNYALKNVRWISDNEVEVEFIDKNSGKTLGTRKISFIDNVETIVNSVELPGPVKGKVVHICVNGEVEVMAKASGEKYCKGLNIFRLENTNLKFKDREIYRSNEPTDQISQLADRIVKVERLTSLKPSGHDVDVVTIGSFDEMGGLDVSRFELRLPNTVKKLSLFRRNGEVEYFWNPSVTKAVVSHVETLSDSRQEIYGYDLERDMRLGTKLNDSQASNILTNRAIYDLRVLRWIDDNTVEMTFADSEGNVKKEEVSFISK